MHNSLGRRRLAVLIKNNMLLISERLFWKMAPFSPTSKIQEAWAHQKMQRWICTGNRASNLIGCTCVDDKHAKGWYVERKSLVNWVKEKCEDVEILKWTMSRHLLRKLGLHCKWSQSPRREHLEHAGLRQLLEAVLISWQDGHMKRIDAGEKILPAHLLDESWAHPTDGSAFALSTPHGRNLSQEQIKLKRQETDHAPFHNRARATLM
jgi:hypothetical protein